MARFSDIGISITAGSITPAMLQRPQGTAMWIEFLPNNLTQAGNYTPICAFPNIANVASTEATNAEGVSFGVDQALDTTLLRRVIEFSRITNVQKAYFETVILTCGTNTDTNHGVLYNQTDGAAVTGTDITVVSTAARVWNRIISADISANLPTVDKTMTLRIYDSGAHQVDMAQARLKLYW